MKKYNTLLLLALTSLLLSACGESKKETTTATTIENPVNTYMDSRLDALEMAKKSVKESSKRVEEQNEKMKSLTH